MQRSSSGAWLQLDAVLAHPGTKQPLQSQQLDAALGHPDTKLPPAHRDVPAESAWGCSDTTLPHAHRDVRAGPGRGRLSRRAYEAHPAAVLPAPHQGRRRAAARQAPAGGQPGVQLACWPGVAFASCIRRLAAAVTRTPPGRSPCGMQHDMPEGACMPVLSPSSREWHS